MAMIDHFRLPEHRKYLFVTDGGHLDNTGLSALLERRCKLMILADASHDDEYSFSNVLGVLHAARAKYGIHTRIAECKSMNELVENQRKSKEKNKKNGCPTTLSALRPDEHGFSDRHFMVLEVTYPKCYEGQQKVASSKGILVLAKSTLTGDEAIELVEMAGSKSEFPHDPTADQFLPPDRFEAYVELGRHIGEQIDKYFSSNELTNYSLPLDWSSDSVALKDDPAFESLSVGERREEFQRILNSRDFDRYCVDFTTMYLDDLMSNGRVRSGDYNLWMDELEDTTDAWSKWARDAGDGQADENRALFCNNVSNMLSRHREIIWASSDCRWDFYLALDLLGVDFPDTAAALQSLKDDTLTNQ